MNIEKIAATASAIDSAIQNNTAIKSIIVEASATIAGDTTEETRQSIQEFLNSPLNDKKEIIMKKAFAAAIAVAQDRGILTDLPQNGSAIAALVDEGLTRVKVGYQVGTGMLDAEKAIEAVIEHAESRAIAFIDKAFESGFVREAATAGLEKLAYSIPEIGPVIGPVVTHYKPVIRSIITKVEKPVQEFVKTGINAVSTAAKSFVRAAAEKVKEVVNNPIKAIGKLLRFA